MAVPQRRISRTRKLKRRANDALSAVQFGRCPRCEYTVRPHTICENCGHYRGMALLPVDEL